MLGCRVGVINRLILDELLYKWDASISSSILDSSDNPVTVGNDITKWVDNKSGINITQGGSFPPVLGSEVRNTVTYNFVRTIRNTNGFIQPESGIMKRNRTMFLVFRQNTGDHTFVEVFLNDDSGINHFRSYHNNDHNGYMKNLATGDIFNGDYPPRIWAVKVHPTTGSFRCIFPLNGNATTGSFRDLAIVISDTPLKIKFGQTENDRATSICLYEILILNTYMSDTDMMDQYNTLITKWGIT